MKPRHQSTAILMMIGSCISYLQQEIPIARVDIKDRLQEGWGTVVDIGANWREWDESKDLALRVVAEWNREIGGIPPDIASQTLVYILGKALYDLQWKTKNKLKLRLLAKLEPIVKDLEEFVDPLRTHELNYDKGEEMLNSFYEKIGWRWE